MLTQVKDLCKEFKLMHAVDHIDEMLPSAQGERDTVIKYLKEILEHEAVFKNEKTLQTRFKQTGFPYLKTIGDFDFDAQPSIKKSDINELMKMEWIKKSFNILIFGPPGIGKTHLAIGLGIQAIHMGYLTFFTDMDNLIKILKTRNISKTSGQKYNKIMSSSLLIIDEVGYSSVSAEEVNLFFQLIRSCHEKTSIVITSNKDFKQWTEFMEDKIIAGAILDRLLHHCQVFTMTGESYRISHRETIFTPEADSDNDD